MLPKNRRMKKAEFSYVFKVGQTFHSKNFILRFLDNKVDNFPRFALSFAKKSGYGAVERNKLKRRVYSLIRQQIAKKPLKKSHFFIFIAKKSVFEIPYKNLKEEIEEILGKF